MMIREPQLVSFCTASSPFKYLVYIRLEGLAWRELRVDGLTVASITAAQSLWRTAARCRGGQRERPRPRVGRGTPGAWPSKSAIRTKPRNPSQGQRRFCKDIVPSTVRSNAIAPRLARTSNPNCCGAICSSSRSSSVIPAGSCRRESSWRTAAITYPRAAPISSAALKTSARFAGGSACCANSEAEIAADC
jgi:hypothetical protein